MDSSSRPQLLRGYRLWFLIDGGVTGVNALAYLALHRILPEVLGSTPTLYLTVGVVLTVITIGLFVVSAAPKRPHIIPELLAGINGLWAIASITVAIVNPLDLTLLGLVWTAAQGLIVLGFSIGQFRALRHSRTAPPPQPRPRVAHDSSSKDH